MTRIIIEKNNRAVTIAKNGDGFYSLLLINTQHGVEHWDAQVVNGKAHSTEAGARRWAAKQLAKA